MDFYVTIIDCLWQPDTEALLVSVDARTSTGILSGWSGPIAIGPASTAQSINQAIVDATEAYVEDQNSITIGPSDRRFLSGMVFVPL